MPAADRGGAASLGRKLGRSFLAVLIVCAVGYFYLHEWFSSQPATGEFPFHLNLAALLLALALGLLSLLADVLIWRMALNCQFSRQSIGCREIFAILFSSGMFRYLPGRFWSVATQALWLGKYGVGKAVTLYVNLLCMAGLLFFSLYTGMLYLAVHSEKVSTGVLFVLLVMLVAVNALCNIYGRFFVNLALSACGGRFKIDIPPIQLTGGMVTLIQLVYFGSWLLLGAAVYALACGLGLPVAVADLLPLLAALSLSWLAGLLAVVVPAGLGVREGVMLWLLKPVLAVQTAFWLPIVTRLLILMVDLLLGLVALWLGLRLRVFALKGRVAP